jgi:hypothetical protein
VPGEGLLQLQRQRRVAQRFRHADGHERALRLPRALGDLHRQARRLRVPCAIAGQRLQHVPRLAGPIAPQRTRDAAEVGALAEHPLLAHLDVLALRSQARRELRPDPARIGSQDVADRAGPPQLGDERIAGRVVRARHERPHRERHRLQRLVARLAHGSGAEGGALPEAEPCGASVGRERLDERRHRPAARRQDPEPIPFAPRGEDPLQVGHGCRVVPCRARPGGQGRRIVEPRRPGKPVRAGEQRRLGADPRHEVGPSGPEEGNERGAVVAADELAHPQRVEVRLQ